jgi:8-amino-7-oxononanoate synthase
MNISETLATLHQNGNYRQLPTDTIGQNIIDLSSNDYLGLGEDISLREEFFAKHNPLELAMTSSASRLLAANQRSYSNLENLLSKLYHRPALLFNSGYHANTGLVSALADNKTLIIADKLVHASIIDGIKLSGANFERFRHNDYTHLNKIIDAKAKSYERILIIAESVYSMDGDYADINQLIAAKKRINGAYLYIDEAHAVGVEGKNGLGLCAEYSTDVDIIVGTLGKALASVGAYAILSDDLRNFMINKARSLIFSTVIPPINAMWSSFIIEKMVDMDDRRAKIKALANALKEAVGGEANASHIRPLVVGNPQKAVDLSHRLLELGYKVLPIRTPTVPAGTDRLRFSLSANIEISDINKLSDAIKLVLKDNLHS